MKGGQVSGTINMKRRGEGETGVASVLLKVSREEARMQREVTKWNNR